MIHVGPKETAAGLTIIIGYVLLIVYLIFRAANAKGSE